MKNYKLYNGVEIPEIGYGTWQIKNEIASNCVQMAIAAGYRHIDSAKVYGNEVGVGEGIRASGIKREDIFVTTKVPAEYKTYKKAKQSIEESLAKLNIGYIDLILIHCPQPWALFGSPFHYYRQNVKVWKALEEAYKECKVRAIGVSNFNISDLQNIIDHCEIKPMVNQIKVHAGFSELDIIDFCKKNDIVVEAYSPIGHGHALNNKTVQQMAEKYGVLASQLLIKYTLQLGTVSLPKASRKEHIEDNLKLDFEISEEDMNILKQLG